VEVVPETRNGGRLVRPAPGHRSLATGTCHASPDEASGATWSREDKTLRREDPGSRRGWAALRASLLLGYVADDRQLELLALKRLECEDDPDDKTSQSNEEMNRNQEQP
jgi:hypothetical protein